MWVEVEVYITNHYVMVEVYVNVCGGDVRIHSHCKGHRPQAYQHDVRLTLCDPYLASEWKPGKNKIKISEKNLFSANLYRFPLHSDPK